MNPFFIWFMGKAAEAFGEKAAELIIGELIAGLNEDSLKVSIEEICREIRKTIDNAFLQEYLADSRSIISRCIDFSDTKEFSILDELYADASDTIEHLKRFDAIEHNLATIQVMAIRLLIVRCYIDKNREFIKVLTRLGIEYAQWAEPVAQKIYDYANNSITLPGGSGGMDSNIRKIYDAHSWSKPDGCDRNEVCVEFSYWSVDVWEKEWYRYGHAFYKPKDQRFDKEDEKDPQYIQAQNKAKKDAEDKRQQIINERINLVNPLCESIRSTCQIWKNGYQD
ncbi:hypothetical protein BK143_09530 [Paenibacillus peoriae]|uniref:hypothetical protein n=1 Tax=Paenibacillus peoriae TaxID=59893 RepID=UPI00096C2F61|nr:hypothetical protein [Paenibacillus peoriae]OMF72499.1 hypothetical protein BK143_09530 [Paenibacillus peoriae]